MVHYIIANTIVAVIYILFGISTNAYLGDTVNKIVFNNFMFGHPHIATL